jgi:outer membrane cobalamin receptor
VGLLLIGIGLFSSAGAAAGGLRGQVIDDASGTPLPGVTLTLQANTNTDPVAIRCDSLGAFFVPLAAGRWQLVAEHLGYASLRQVIEIGQSEIQLMLHLKIQALILDELVIQGRHAGGPEGVAAFVERIPVEAGQPGVSLADLLDQAAGVQIRRYGGLGSFSTVSIRGSTAEQVQIYLDGVPLNQAAGGGVDLGNLPISGIHSIEVYRGAVPARFGGNSLGGVIQLRSQQANGRTAAKIHTELGSFGTRRTGGSASRRWGVTDLLGTAEYSESRNNFTFIDDNGTEYNLNDDAQVKRANSDFHSFRALAKAERPLNTNHRLRLQNTFDLSHKGSPGIGNFQSEHARYDSWRHLAEAQAFGLLPSWGRPSYRMSAYYMRETGEYKDLFGEVGAGVEHERNTTLGLGLRAEANVPLLDTGLFTAFGGARRETFDPDNLLQRQSRLLNSRRHAGLLGGEAEVPLWGRLRLSGGGQLERIRDVVAERQVFGPEDLAPAKRNTQTLWGYRLGGRLALWQHWTLQGHRGRYSRPPSFFELFGDRGALLGNTDLVSERGDNLDLGLVYRNPASGRTGPFFLGLVFAEAVYYRNTVRDLIRFIQNSQRVSRPHNIGKALLQGFEGRTQLRLSSRFTMRASYVYQRAENRAPFSFEKGNDLPNAPRHTAQMNATLRHRGQTLRYEMQRESRHFMDRANLRIIPSRLIHTLGGSVRLAPSTEALWEVRNLTDNQVADLWGFPLPGRAFFVTLRQDIKTWSE